MKKVLILCLHRPDRSPSQRFRIEQYMAFLEQNGYSFDFSYLLNEHDDQVYYRPGHLMAKLGIVLKSAARRLSELFKSNHYDLVFVQREAFMLGTAFFEKSLGRKLPMIFDFDDSIWLQVVSEANKRLSFLKDASKTARIIQASSFVFAGNEYLASYARQYNKNVVVIPTTIDTDKYRRAQIEREANRVCIGWSGSFSTIEHFETAIPALIQIKEKFGDAVRFKIIGDKNYYCKELGVKGQAWSSVTEVEDLSDIDIGIMPLPDTEWAKGKCGAKGLQYMGLGIATLMSPVGVNASIISDGQNGYLPTTTEEWVRDISALVEQPLLRKKIGDAGRQTVVERYSVLAWKHEYLRLFNEVTAKKKPSAAVAG